MGAESAQPKRLPIIRVRLRCSFFGGVQGPTPKADRVSLSIVIGLHESAPNLGAECIGAYGELSIRLRQLDNRRRDESEFTKFEQFFLFCGGGGELRRMSFAQQRVERSRYPSEVGYRPAVHVANPEE